MELTLPFSFTEMYRNYNLFCLHSYSTAYQYHLKPQSKQLFALNNPFIALFFIFTVCLYILLASLTSLIIPLSSDNSPEIPYISVSCVPSPILEDRKSLLARESKESSVEYKVRQNLILHYVNTDYVYS